MLYDLVTHNGKRNGAKFEDREQLYENSPVGGKMEFNADEMLNMLVTKIEEEEGTKVAFHVSDYASSCLMMMILDRYDIDYEPIEHGYIFNLEKIKSYFPRFYKDITDHLRALHKSKK